MPAQSRTTLPNGLVYRPDFVTGPEERALIAGLEGLDYQQVVMHGVAAKRTVVHFGHRYGYESFRVEPGPPIPELLLDLRTRCAVLAGLEADALEQCLVSRYPPGAGIGWHRDAPRFGPTVIGVSLLSGCRMRFQRTTDTGREVHALELAPRSAYVLSGTARSQWQHSIPGCPELRYSITFRTLRRKAAPA